jgi:hypothetical protein
MSVDSDKELLDRGRQVLIETLGPAGALDFLRASANLPDNPDEGDGISRTLINVYGSDRTSDLLIKFSHSVSWLRITKTDAQELIKALTELTTCDDAS